METVLLQHLMSRIADYEERLKKLSEKNRAAYEKIRPDQVTCELKKIIEEKMLVLDTIPVVRCRDCKYAEPCYGNELAYMCRITGRIVKDDCFCSDGRKGKRGE